MSRRIASSRSPYLKPFIAVVSIAGLVAAATVACSSDEQNKCGDAAHGISCNDSRDAFADVVTNDGNLEDDAIVPDAADGAADAHDDATDASDAGMSIDAAPIPLATSLSSPWRLAIGGGYVYATSGGNVLKIAMADGATQTITQAGSIEWVIADATNLYFTTISGVVYKRAHAGSTNVPISNATVALQVSGLAVDATYVYWTEDTNGGTVLRVPIDGSALAGESVSPGLVLPRGVALSGSDIYVAESAGTTGTGRILKLAPSKGTPIPLATNRAGPSRPITDGTRIFWVENQGSGLGPVPSVPLAGGTLVAHAGTAVDPSIVVDGANLYYGNATGGIVKVDIATNVPKILYYTDQTGSIYGLGIAGSSLYWTDFNGGRVMTAAK